MNLIFFPQQQTGASLLGKNKYLSISLGFSVLLQTISMKDPILEGYHVPSNGYRSSTLCEGEGEYPEYNSEVKICQHAESFIALISQFGACPRMNRVLMPYRKQSAADKGGCQTETLVHTGSRSPFQSDKTHTHLFAC